MNTDFCTRDCKYLNIIEDEQELQHKIKQPHICLKYNTRVYHSLPFYAHPELFKCEKCRNNTKV